MDFHTNLTFKVQKGRGLGSRDPSSKFWDPLITWTNRAIRFKFSADIEDGPLLRPDHKTTPKWAWPRSRDQISKFWDPLITFDRIELSASNLAQTYTNTHSKFRPSIHWPINRIQWPTACKKTLNVSAATVIFCTQTLQPLVEVPHTILNTSKLQSSTVVTTTTNETWQCLCCFYKAWRLN